MPPSQMETQAARITSWDATVAKNPPTVDYEAVMRSDDGVKEWTALIVSC